MLDKVREPRLTGSPDHPSTRSPDHPITESPGAFCLPPLYAIIDPAQSEGRSPVEVAEDLLAAGVRLIQLRDKRASPRGLYETARQLAALVRRAGGLFVVNDRADIALAADADGVHVGQDDLPVESARQVVGRGKLVGFSTHNPEQVREADRSTADYVAFGPIYSTTSKANPDPLVGLEGLAHARTLTRKPLVAIGGITLENVRPVLEAGADSMAIIRGLVGAKDIAQRAREFLSMLHFSKPENSQG